MRLIITEGLTPEESANVAEQARMADAVTAMLVSYFEEDLAQVVSCIGLSLAQLLAVGHNDETAGRILASLNTLAAQIRATTAEQANA